MATHRLQHLVTGGSAFTAVITDGALVEQVPGDDQDAADLVLTMKGADAAAIGSGELRLDEGFMQGRVKIVGSMGTVMDLLEVLRSEPYLAAVAAAASKA